MRTDELADRIGATLRGEVREVGRLVPPGGRGADAVVVAADDATLATVLEGLASEEAPSEAVAAILTPAGARPDGPHPPLLLHEDPRLALARIGRLLDREPVPDAGVDPTARISTRAALGANVRIGPFVTVEAGAQIGDECVLDAGCVVGEDCRIGPGTRLFPRVVLYPRVRIGARCRLHAGVVVGADGFGYAPGPAGAEKIHHMGAVVLGDDVEVGAGTCIDRGTLDDTVVGSGSKIDNLCQIGHNVRIGRHCLIAGHAAIGGSTRLGDGVMLGGGVAITDHVTVHDGARIAGRAGISKDVPAGETWGGIPAAPIRDWARERYLIHRLERIWSFVRDRERGA